MDRAKFGILYSPQFPDIWQNLDGGISVLDFWSIPYKGKLSCHRTSVDIDMKLGPVTKLDKRNKTSEKFDDAVMPGNCEVIGILPIYS